MAAFLWMSSEWREPGLPGLILAFLITAARRRADGVPLLLSELQGVRSDRRVVRLHPGGAAGLRGHRACDPPTCCWRCSAATRCRRRCCGSAGACGAPMRGAPRRAQQSMLERAPAVSGGAGHRAAAACRRPLARSRGMHRRRQPAAARLPLAPVSAPALPPRRRQTAGRAEDAQLWEALRAEVSVCTRCALHQSAPRACSASGRARRLLVIGEAPGAEEDRQGEPFVGRAGQLLNSMLRGHGPNRARTSTSPTCSSAGRPATAIRSRRRWPPACRT